MNLEKNPKSDPLICICNEIPKSTIEAAIQRGCHKIQQIFSSTTAGLGQCGGSCQPTLRKMLEVYLQTGKFPEDPKSLKNKS